MNFKGYLNRDLSAYKVVSTVILIPLQVWDEGRENRRADQKEGTTVICFLA
jgi:hypothetical protein